MVVGQRLHHLTDINDERVLDRWCHDPFAGGIAHFEAAYIVLQENGEHADIAVGTGAHRLVDKLVLRRIMQEAQLADRLAVLVVADVPIEAQCQSEGLQ